MTCGDDSLLATIDGDESIKVSGNDTASGDVFASITRQILTLRRLAFIRRTHLHCGV